MGELFCLFYLKGFYKRQRVDSNKVFIVELFTFVGQTQLEKLKRFYF